MEKMASQIIVDILRTELGLPQSHVWLDELNYNIPIDESLMISVGVVSVQPMGAKSSLKTDDDEDVYEVIQTVQREDINIDIMSRSATVLLRKWEIIGALNSIYAQQMQEKYRFKIAKIPTSFVNTSLAEGGSQLARFTLSISCHVWYKKETLLAPDGKKYFDEFKTRVDDESTIGTENGIIEFTIDENTEI